MERDSIKGLNPRKQHCTYKGKFSFCFQVELRQYGVPPWREWRQKAEMKVIQVLSLQNTYVCFH